jgi:nicotinate-nucleotide adenylyltransferase
MAMRSGPRIGILGGTFDPVHIGHLVAAVNARHACGLDKVLLMVANVPWQKIGRDDIAPAELRAEAVAEAVQGHEGLEVCRMEVDRGGPSYTVETLEQLRSQQSDATFFLIQGADSAAGMPTWKDADRIAELADVIVVNRPGQELPAMGPGWRTHGVEIPPLDVSSTDLRRRLRDGRPVDFLIPDRAVAVLRSSGLYAGGVDVPSCTSAEDTAETATERS